MTQLILFLSRRPVPVAVALAGGIVALVMGIVVVHNQVEAQVTGLASASATCNSVTVNLTDNGVGNGLPNPRTGEVYFVGPVAIAPIALSCAAGAPAGQCPEPDSYTVAVTYTGGPHNIDIGFLNGPSRVFTVCADGADCGIQGSVTLPNCTPPAAPSAPAGPGRRRTVTTTVVEEAPAAPVFAPLVLDPPGSPPRVWGGLHDTGGVATDLVVYQQPYGYQFYHRTGEVLGLVDFSTASIPGPLGLIASLQAGDSIHRVDVYYLHDDRIQANLYENGVLIEEAWFDVAGVGGRSTGGPGLTVPALPGQAVVSTQPDGGVPDGAPVAEVLCRQNLRQGTSIDTAIMSLIDPGERLNVNGRTNDGSWLNVTTPNGLTGWVFNGRCVAIGGQLFQAPVEVVFTDQPTVSEQGAAAPQGAPAPPAAAAVDGVTPVVSIVCRQHLRSGPGDDYASQSIMTPGTTLSVNGRSPDASWLQVSGSGLSGWTYFGQCVLPQVGDITAAPVTIAFGGG